MPEYKYSINSNDFVTRESIVSRQVMGMTEKDAINLIEKNGLLWFVERKERQVFEPDSKVGHSYRIKLSLKKGKVYSTSIG